MRSALPELQLAAQLIAENNEMSQKVVLLLLAAVMLSLTSPAVAEGGSVLVACTAGCQAMDTPTAACEQACMHEDESVFSFARIPLHKFCDKYCANFAFLTSDCLTPCNANHLYPKYPV